MASVLWLFVILNDFPLLIFMNLPKSRSCSEHLGVSHPQTSWGMGCRLYSQTNFVLSLCPRTSKSFHYILISEHRGCQQLLHAKFFHHVRFLNITAWAESKFLSFWVSHLQLLISDYFNLFKKATQNFFFIISALFCLSMHIFHIVVCGCDAQVALLAMIPFFPE